MGCSRTCHWLCPFQFRSNNTNKWDAQEPLNKKFKEFQRSNNTNKWDAQERIASSFQKVRRSNNTNKWDAQEQLTAL